MSATISAPDLDRLLRADPGTALLDVRTPLEFAGGHVPQARNAPLGGFDPPALAGSGAITTGRPVYLLCKSGARARQAAERLARAGFEEAVVVEGGTEAWSRAGLPLAGGGGPGVSIERQVRIVAGSLVLAGFLLAWLVHPWFLALSAFVGAGLVFAGVTDFCSMGLLLARAPWNGRAA